jgi:hypothetical protein
MDLGEIRWIGMDLINVAQNRGTWRALVNTEIKLRVPQNAGNFFSRCITSGPSKRT